MLTNMARMPILRSVPTPATLLNMSGMSYWLMRAIVFLAAASARKRASNAILDELGDVLVLVVQGLMPIRVVSSEVLVVVVVDKGLGIRMLDSESLQKGDGFCLDSRCLARRAPIKRFCAGAMFLNTVLLYKHKLGVVGTIIIFDAKVSQLCTRESGARGAVKDL